MSRSMKFLSGVLVVLVLPAAAMLYFGAPSSLDCSWSGTIASCRVSRSVFFGLLVVEENTLQDVREAGVRATTDRGSLGDQRDLSRYHVLLFTPAEFHVLDSVDEPSSREVPRILNDFLLDPGQDRLEMTEFPGRELVLLNIGYAVLSVAGLAIALLVANAALMRRFATEGSSRPSSLDHQEAKFGGPADQPETSKSQVRGMIGFVLMIVVGVLILESIRQSIASLDEPQVAPTMKSIKGREPFAGMTIPPTGDEELTREWLRCRVGQLASCSQVAASYEEGDRVPVQLDVAANLRQIVCAESRTACPALRRLAERIEQGTGVAANPDLATRLYEAACKGGDEPACEHGD